MNLKDYLYDERIKHKDLAKAVGVSSTAVSLWLSKKANPTGVHILKMSKFLGIRPTDVMEMIKAGGK